MSEGATTPTRAPRTTAVLSVGSNLGDRLAHLASVVDGFTVSDEVLAVSPVYVTPPWGGVEQDDFYNIALIVVGERDGPRGTGSSRMPARVRRAYSTAQPGSSTSTASPGCSSMRETRSSACVAT